jgi:uncharacterized protein DUF6370
MRAVLLATAFAFVVLGAGPAPAADKEPAAAKAEKAPASAAKKPAAGEVTLTGDMMCAKCVLHEAKKCQNVLRVTEGGTETKYYLAQNKVAKDNHEEVCGKTAKATVTGKVSDKGGKKELTASTIKYE